MQLQDKVVVVTGGANGIGVAMAKRFKQQGLRGLAIADLDAAKVSAAAAQPQCVGVRCDVTREHDVRHVAETAQKQFGPVDLFCSNAGIAFLGSICSAKPPTTTAGWAGWCACGASCAAANAPSRPPRRARSPHFVHAIRRRAPCTE